MIKHTKLSQTQLMLTFCATVLTTISACSPVIQAKTATPKATVSKPTPPATQTKRKLFYPSEKSGTQQLNCSAVKAGQNITVKGSTEFSNNCQLPKNVTFRITSSNINLDCNGAKLASTERFKRSAFYVVSDQPINNISINNCHVTGYGHALHILKKTSPRDRYLAGNKNPDKLRQSAPHDITINNLTSDSSINSAIFIGDHIHHVTMNNLTVIDAGTVGIYFEFGSSHNVVKNSNFTGNGHRRFKPDREAIAIDSSMHNLIENNRFSKNGAGAVFLYRNCFEHAADKTRGNHFLRTESSDHNRIVNNHITDEEVGVWVASRQSRDMRGFKCGAFEMKKTTFATYHEDAAEHNLIQGNTFRNVEQSVIVEDDKNHVTGNTFVNVDQPAIMVGSTIKASTKLGAVKHVEVSKNQFKDCRNCVLEEVIRYRASEAFGQCGNVIADKEKKATETACKR